jgi:hypothetical protein
MEQYLSQTHGIGNLTTKIPINSYTQCKLSYMGGAIFKVLGAAAPTEN